MTSQFPDIKTDKTPIRAPSAVPVDDAVLPFEVDALDLRGRLTRLGPALDDVLAKHDYPAPVAKLLGEAIVLATLLGSSLKFDGRFILQTQTDGPVSFLIVDFQAPDRLRAYARYDAAAPEGGPGFRRAARQGPSRHDHRSGARHEPLPGPGGARRRHARGRRARVFPALRTDPDPGAARGRRGVARRRRRAAETSLARRRHAAAIPAQGARAGAAGRPASRRRAARASSPTRSRRTTPGSRASR